MFFCKKIFSQLWEGLYCNLIWFFLLDLVAVFPNLNQKLRMKSQTIQNKCICVCQNLHKIPHASLKEFKTQYWTPVSNGCDHNDLINGLTMWYLNTLIACALITYLNETLKLLLIPVLIYETLFFKLKTSFWEKTIEKKSLSNIGYSFVLYQVPESPDKKTCNTNNFKHNLKTVIFRMSKLGLILNLRKKIILWFTLLSILRNQLLLLFVTAFMILLLYFININYFLLIWYHY